MLRIIRCSSLLQGVIFQRKLKNVLTELFYCLRVLREDKNKYVLICRHTLRSCESPKNSLEVFYAILKTTTIKQFLFQFLKALNPPPSRVCGESKTELFLVRLLSRGRLRVDWTRHQSVVNGSLDPIPGHYLSRRAAVLIAEWGQW